jgi:hypothetical protein
MVLSWRFAWFIILLWLPCVACAVLFIYSWKSGLLWRPGLVGAWGATGLALVGVSVALSSRVPGAYFGTPPMSVLGGPLSAFWLLGQLICIGVTIYLVSKLGIR